MYRKTIINTIHSSLHFEDCTFSSNPDIIQLAPTPVSEYGCQRRRWPVRISARNILKGKIKQVRPGVVNTEVILEFPGGSQIVSIITKESADKLELMPGREAYAIIKASNVMIGVE